MTREPPTARDDLDIARRGFQTYNRYGSAPRPRNTGTRKSSGTSGLGLGDEGAGRVRQAYGDRQYERLVALKRDYDPTNFFRLNQNIEP